MRQELLNSRNKSRETAFLFSFNRNKLIFLFNRLKSKNTPSTCPFFQIKTKTETKTANKKKTTKHYFSFLWDLKKNEALTLLCQKALLSKKKSDCCYIKGMVRIPHNVRFSLYMKITFWSKNILKDWNKCWRQLKCKKKIKSIS